MPFLCKIASIHTLIYQSSPVQYRHGYYTDPSVFEALGYSTPQPAIGGQPELLDESLLEKQRQRAPFWTRV